MQQAKALDELLARVLDARERVRLRAGPVPLLVKIAPDLTLSELDDAVGIARKHRVDGMIVGNTTIARPGALRERDLAKQTGGLSGRPLFKLATRMLAETFVRAEGAFPLIGAGGIDCRPDRHRQDQGGREPAAALHRARLSRHRRGGGDQGGLSGGAQARPPQFAGVHGRRGRGRHDGGELAELSARAAR